MGNKFCVEEQVQPKDFLAKQNVSLFFLDKDHQIQSQLCDKSSMFSLLDDSFNMWWKVKTMVGDREVVGTASRLYFYPVGGSSEEEEEEREESQVWHFGELARTQAEELLSHTANDQGAFMVRFSNKHKKLVLSVKMFNDESSEYEYKHFIIKKSPNWGHAKPFYSLFDDIQHGSLSDLVMSCQSDESSSVSLSSVCLIPNPISDKTFLRSWEIESQADQWMIPRAELSLGVELGHGFFGSVHRGVWREELEVAIKTLRDKHGKDQKEFEKQKTTFLQETETMKKLNHPNLVKMIGICVEKSPFYLIQELCQNGDLKNYLKKYDFVKVHHSMAYLKNRKQSDEEKERYAKVPSLNSLIIWCKEIIKGMCYLESHNLVHRDLAARNVLLDHHLQAKVGDFGLTMHDKICIDEEKPAMAVLWCAPEAIERKEFSTMSDVWSFGITMWEILSFAEKPYSGLKKSLVKEKLKTSNYMMDPPVNYLRYNKERWQMAYQIMKECWHKIPRQRPKFKALLVKVSKLLQDKGKLSASSRNRMNNNVDAWTERRKVEDIAGSVNFQDIEDYDVTDSTSTSFYDYEMFTVIK